MAPGVHVSTDLIGGLHKEYGKLFGKYSKTMWTTKITP
jgi:hypothetical protein